MNTTYRTTAALATTLGIALIAFPVTAQLQAPQPNQTATEAGKAARLAKPGKPDFTVAIDRVFFACPGTSDQPSFATMQVRIKNNSMPFDLNKPISWRWTIDGVNRNATGTLAGYPSTVINNIGWIHSNLTIPASWFTNIGKPDPTKLAQPKSVVVSFSFDTTNAIDEANEANNVAETTATIPAMLCK